MTPEKSQPSFFPSHHLASLIQTYFSSYALHSKIIPSIMPHPGRILILIGNLAYAIGAFVFDYNETHVKNPRWPPHAKFHNGQTMTLGALLASTSLFFLFRPAVSVTRQKENALYAAVIGSFYCAAGLSAILYPGTAWQE